MKTPQRTHIGYSLITIMAVAAIFSLAIITQRAQAAYSVSVSTTDQVQVYWANGTQVTAISFGIVRQDGLTNATFFLRNVNQTGALRIEWSSNVALLTNGTITDALDDLSGNNISDTSLPANTSIEVNYHVNVGAMAVPGAYSWSLSLSSQPTLAPSTTATQVIDDATRASPSGTEVAGASFHDTSTVAGVTGVLPTGNLTYEFFTTGDCSRTPTPQMVILNPDGSVPASSSTGELAAGNYSFQATYSGDDNYLLSTSACESFTVNKATPLIATAILPSSQIVVGGSVTDQAALTGGFPLSGITGSVTYSFFSGDTCSATTMISSQTFPMGADDSVPATSAFTPSSLGSFSIEASYGGDSNNNQATSACEPFNVTDFMLTATPSSNVTPANSNATSTITVATLNGFTGTISLTDITPPSLTCSPISPTSVTNFGTATVSCSSATAGTYTLTVTGTSGPLSHSTTVIFNVTDFSISATSPTAVTVNTPAISTINVNAINGFTGNVSLTDTLPSGLTCGTISQTNVTSSGIATVSCNSPVAGTYTLIITGAGGTLSHSTTAKFIVTDFTLEATSPTPVTIGTSSASTITVTALNGFTGTVVFHPPSPCTLSPSSITSSGNATLSCMFTYGGTYIVTIIGTSGTISHSTMVTMNVMDFSLTASPSSIIEPQGPPGGTTMVIVTSLGGFSGTVGLTASTPTGFTALSSPSSIVMSGTSMVTIFVSPPATPGVYLVNITGTSGNLQHTVTITVTVTSMVTVQPPLFTQGKWEHRFSLSKYANVQVWRFGVQNNSTNTTVYFSVTISGTNTAGTSSFVLTTPVFSEGPQKNMAQISLSQPFTASQLADTFTFNMVIYWGTTPTTHPSQLPFISTQTNGAPTSGSFTILS